MVLPLLGSSMLRDTMVLPVDFMGDPWSYKNPASWRYVGSALRLVDKRAEVLGASNLIEEAALDRYEFVRDAYLQRRQNTIDDGKDTKGSVSFDENGRIKAADGTISGDLNLNLNLDIKPAQLLRGLVKYLRPGETAPKDAAPVGVASDTVNKKDKDGDK